MTIDDELVDLDGWSIVVKRFSDNHFEWPSGFMCQAMMLHHPSPFSFAFTSSTFENLRDMEGQWWTVARLKRVIQATLQNPVAWWLIIGYAIIWDTKHLLSIIWYYMILCRTNYTTADSWESVWTNLHASSYRTAQWYPCVTCPGSD